MLTIYGDTWNSEKEWSDCQVMFRNENEIAVSYDDEPGYVTYIGCEISKGYYELSAPEVRGKANLRWQDDGDTLEGSWVEGPDAGLWRIELGDQDEISN